MLLFSFGGSRNNFLESVEEVHGSVYCSVLHGHGGHCAVGGVQSIRASVAIFSGTRNEKPEEAVIVLCSTDDVREVVMQCVHVPFVGINEGPHLGSKQGHWRVVLIKISL